MVPNSKANVFADRMHFPLPKNVKPLKASMFTRKTISTLYIQGAAKEVIPCHILQIFKQAFLIKL